MKRTHFSLLIAFTFSLFLCPLQAQDSSTYKIGVVDVKRIFDEYEKTKEALKDVNDRRVEAQKERDESMAKYKELLEKFEGLKSAFNDESLTPELRQAKGEEANAVGQEARALERRIRDLNERRARQLQEQMMRVHKMILEEIRTLVEQESKTRNFDMVFDKSGTSAAGVPFLLFSKDAVDFSDDILATLNKNASSAAGN